MSEQEKKTEYSQQQVETWKQEEEERRESNPQSSQHSTYDHEDKD